MFFRTAIPSTLFVFAILASAVAVWQALEVRVRDKRIADMARASATSSRAPRNAEMGRLSEIAAELAASRQQLSATEKAVMEAESRLSEEITAHAALKAKASDLSAALAEAERTNVAAKAEADAVRQSVGQQAVAKPVTPSAIETTGSIAAAPAAKETPLVATPITPEVKPDVVKSDSPARRLARSKPQPAKTAVKRAPALSQQTGSPWMQPYR